MEREEESRTKDLQRIMTMIYCTALLGYTLQHGRLSPLSLPLHSPLSGPLDLKKIILARANVCSQRSGVGNSKAVNNAVFIFRAKCCLRIISTNPFVSKDGLVLDIGVLSFHFLLNSEIKRKNMNPSFFNTCGNKGF